MDLGASGSSSLLGSLRGLVESVFGSAVDRVELLSIELQEEKQRLIRTFVWITAFLFSALLALLFVSGAIIIAFWTTAARVPIVVGFAALYTALAVAAGFQLRRALSQPSPFAATLEELHTDQECLRGSEKN